MKYYSTKQEKTSSEDRTRKWVEAAATVSGCQADTSSKAEVEKVDEFEKEFSLMQRDIDMAAARLRQQGNLTVFLSPSLAKPEVRRRQYLEHHIRKIFFYRAQMTSANDFLVAGPCNKGTESTKATTEARARRNHRSTHRARRCNLRSQVRRSERCRGRTRTTNVEILSRGKINEYLKAILKSGRSTNEFEKETETN